MTTVVPMTSNTDRIYPFQLLLPANETGLDVDSKAQAEQVRAVAVERLGEVAGSLEFEQTQQPALSLANQVDGTHFLSRSASPRPTSRSTAR